MSSKLTVREFFKRFPDDDACLEHVMSVRYGLRHECGRCGQDATFHRIAKRKAYACSRCGDHVYPCAGTIFEDSRTPLHSGSTPCFCSSPRDMAYPARNYSARLA